MKYFQAEFVENALTQQAVRESVPVAPERDDASATLTALKALTDPGTVQALEPLGALGFEADPAIVTCLAQVRGKPVVCYATDGSKRGGALTAAGCDQVVQAIETARTRRIPVIGLWHSGGAALHEGTPALDGVGRIFTAIVAASGVVPQISVVLGPAAGGAAYGAALTDIVVMTEEARVFVTGPAVVGQVTGQRLTAAELGGTEVHSQFSGVAHLIVPDGDEAVARTADLVELLTDTAPRGTADTAPRGTADTAPRGTADTAPRGTAGGPDHRDPGLRLPESSRRAYDVRGLVTDLLDDGMINLQERWAPNVVTALGRLAGHTVGVVANNPIRRGGCLDAASGDKAARFVRFCDSFGIPLIVLVDVPGYLPGLDQERNGVVRRGAKLLHAFAGARVTRITVIIRKAFGGAYVAMNSKSLGATVVLAWPSADIGIMNPGSAVDVLHRRELAACAAGAARTALREERLRDYTQRAGGLARAVQDGSVDAIIEPAHTRNALAALLASHVSCPSSRPNLPL